MTYNSIYPFWDKLTDIQKEEITKNCNKETLKKGSILCKNSEKFKGLLTVLSGQLRVYILSNEGREVTLFRVKQNEVCVISASSLMDLIDYNLEIEASEDTQVLVLPNKCLNKIQNDNVYVDLYVTKKGMEKFSDVIFTMHILLFKRIDQRIANLLLEESNEKNTLTLNITHDEIAKYIGSAREVVTKVLKHLSENNVIELHRGKIIIINKEELIKYI